MEGARGQVDEYIALMGGPSEEGLVGLDERLHVARSRGRGWKRVEAAHECWRIRVDRELKHRQQAHCMRIPGRSHTWYQLRVLCYIRPGGANGQVWSHRYSMSMMIPILDVYSDIRILQFHEEVAGGQLAAN